MGVLYSNLYALFLKDLSLGSGCTEKKIDEKDGTNGYWFNRKMQFQINLFPFKSISDDVVQFFKSTISNCSQFEKIVYDLVNNDVSVRHQNNRSRNIYFYKSYFVIQVDCLIHSGENV